MDDLRLAGSRRNAQEDRGEERTYKVTVNTAVDPFSALIAGTVGAWVAAHHADRVTKDGIHDLGVFTDLKEEAVKQRAKRQEELNQSKLPHGKTTSEPYEGGHLEGFGAALGKFVVDALSQKTKEVQKALEKKPEEKKQDASEKTLSSKTRANVQEIEKPQSRKPKIPPEPRRYFGMMGNDGRGPIRL
jgi:hypothetical protein